jgi:hypothetical protein
MFVWQNPQDPIADFDDDDLLTDANWTEGASMFGACLETATNGAAGGIGVGGWPVAGNDACTVGSTAWRPVVADGSPDSKVAAVTPGPDVDAAVSIRFGLRTADNQPPGRYEARVSMEVVAPDS